jgi:hypothetical protein
MEEYMNYIRMFIKDIFLPSLQTKDPLEERYLGKDIYLVPLKIRNDKNVNKYGHLYKNGIKLNNKIFRVGGMSSGFKEKENYCNLIYYDKIKSFGNHCIINTDGEIVLMAANTLRDPYFLKGCIATMDKIYYNLITRKPIVKGYNSINSEKYLFVENQYEIGVYKIEYETGEYEIFK